MAILFQCHPVSLAWDKSVVGGKCIDVAAVEYAGAAMSILEDLVILVMPLPQLNMLNVDLGKHLGLMFMFSVGSVSVPHPSPRNEANANATTALA